MDLRLIPSHPDLAAGLAFFSPTQAKYSFIAFALSAVFAASIGEQIVYGRASLSDQKLIIIGYLVIVPLVLLAPLLVFSPKLWVAKQKGLQEYSALAGEYTQAFHSKWIRKGAGEGEVLLGSADIQSLADMGNSFGFVRNMRTFPIDRNGLLPIVVATALPMLPLLLTVYPFDELVLKVIGLMF